MQRQLKALFSGTVQGVGFRFTAEWLARHFAVTGYVRNLSNGKVELVAEGEETTVKDFLKAVEDAMKNYIRNKKIFWSEPEGQYSDFGIGY